MDVGLHRVKTMRRDILKPEILLDIFMKNLHRPAQTVSQYNLARRHSEITTGSVVHEIPHNGFGSSV